MDGKRRFGIRFDVIGIIGILVGVAGLYTYYKGTKPRLEIVVNGSANVVDVNEKVPGLAVAFNGENLLASNKVLTIYFLTVANSGNDSLRKNDFDTDAPVGVKIDSASVLSAQILPELSSQTSYIRKQASLDFLSPNSVKLRPLILDPGDRVGMRLVVLHDASVKPKVTSFGKVVGQTGIPVSFVSTVEDDRSLWIKAFGGGLGVNLVRLPGYFLGFVLLLAVAIGVPVSIGSFRKKLARKRKVKEFFRLNQRNAMNSYFAERYVDGDGYALERLSKLTPESALLRLSDSHQRSQHRIVVDRGVTYVSTVDGVSLSALGLASGVVHTATDGTLKINDVALQELNKFLAVVGPISTADGPETD